MIPGKYNIVCPQGSTFSQQITYSVDDALVNLTGYSARMQVREKHTSTNAILDLDTDNGGITLGGALGTITMTATSDATALISAKDYLYDIELVNGSTVTRIREGKFTVTPEVTR